MKKKFSLGRGLVKMSRSWSNEDTNSSEYFSFLNIIPNKVVSNLNVFSLRVKYWVFGEVYGASVITFYQDNSKINIVIIEFLFHPYNTHIKTTHNNIFRLICG